MARSDVETYLLLNHWPQLLHEDVWKFNQLSGPGVRSGDCEIYIQFERDYIANALYHAVQQGSDYLGFFPVPTYIEGEVIQLETGSDWRDQILDTKYGYLQAFGKRAVTLVEENVNVTYTDTDGDGVMDTASLTVTTAVADSELYAFFRTADGAPSNAHEYWRVEPLSVSTNGGDKTLCGHRALFVKPSAVWAHEYVEPNYYEKFAGNTGTTAHFVTAVDVYRVYTDPTNAVTLLSDPADTTPTETQVTAWIQDAKHGCITLREPVPATADPIRPIGVRVSYLAGFPLVKGMMDRRLEVALTRYANTLMPHQPCYCDPALQNWKADRDVPEALSEKEAKHPPPFGITTGGIFAWGVVNALRLPDKGRPVDAPSK